MGKGNVVEMTLWAAISKILRYLLKEEGIGYENGVLHTEIGNSYFWIFFCW